MKSKIQNLYDRAQLITDYVILKRWKYETMENQKNKEANELGHGGKKGKSRTRERKSELYASRRHRHSSLTEQELNRKTGSEDYHHV